MSTKKTPLQFHPVSYNSTLPIPEVITEFSETINAIYPRVLTMYDMGREEEYQWARFHLRNHPHFSRYAMESFPQWLYGQTSLSPIAAPQHCDPSNVLNHPERLIVEISPVVIPFYESRVGSQEVHRPRVKILGIPFGKKPITQYKPMERIEVGSYHCRIFELIEQEMSHDSALQYAYRITFVRYNGRGWEARAHLLPYSHAKYAVEILQLGPVAVLLFFASLLAEHEEDRKNMTKDFLLDRITHVAARVILDEHITSFLGEFTPDDEPVLTSPVYYYGTSRGNGFSLDTPIHHGIESATHQEFIKLEKFMKETGVSYKVFTSEERCPRKKYPYPDGHAHMHHIHGWTCLAFLDSLYDGRPGSTSTFFTQGIWSFETMCKIARLAYPDIWQRFDERGIRVVIIPQ